jgi:hypothetical protein
MTVLEELRSQFNGRMGFKEKRPGVIQVFAPLFHEDGDMIDIFLDLPINGSSTVRISDHGLTLMRLSYSFDIDTPNKKRILGRMVSENGVQEHNGVLFVDTRWESLYPALLQFAQLVAKVTNMQLFKREVIQSLFYELLDESVVEKLKRFGPRSSVFPLEERDDLEVPYAFGTERPVYLFGVKDNQQARLATISCLAFQKEKLRFTSVIVHEDFEVLTKKDRTRITNAADKQFTSLEDFRANAEEYLEREAA